MKRILNTRNYSDVEKATGDEEGEATNNQVVDETDLVGVPPGAASSSQATMGRTEPAATEHTTDGQWRSRLRPSPSKKSARGHAS